MQKKNDFTWIFDLCQHYWLYFLITVCCGIAAGIILAKFVVPKKYEANVTIYIGCSSVSQMDNTQPSRLTAALVQELAIGSQLAKDYMELVKSRRIRARAVEKIRQQQQQYDIPFSLKSTLPLNTRVLKLSVTAKNPDAACFIANTLSQVFVTDVAEIFELKNSRIIDNAESAQLVFPKVPVFAVLGFLLAGGIFVLVIYLRMMLDTKIHTPEQLSELLNLPVIGTVPFDSELAGLEDGDSGSTGSRVISLNDGSTSSRFGIREAFWSIRTNLLYSDLKSNQGAKVIAITSAWANEGKTFVGANVAATLADFGNRVLIINCDLRKPALSYTLGLHNESGLVNILVEHCPVEKVLHRNLFDKSLDALLCGPVPLNPLKLLNSDEFKNLLSDLRKQYDYIFLDSPPCLEISDGIFLSGIADAAILVCRLEVMRENVILEAIDRLKQAKIVPLGIIANGASNSGHGYYRRYGYGYGYGHGYGHGYGYGYGYHPKEGSGRKNGKEILVAAEIKEAGAEKDPDAEKNKK